MPRRLRGDATGAAAAAGARRVWVGAEVRRDGAGGSRGTLGKMPAEAGAEAMRLLRAQVGEDGGGVPGEGEPLRVDVRALLRERGRITTAAAAAPAPAPPPPALPPPPPPPNKHTP